MAVTPKLKEFRVVEDRNGNLELFQTNVNELLNNKWRISGSLVVTRIPIMGGDTYTYHQAMTRYHL